jgi:hypothetical protein
MNPILSVGRVRSRLFRNPDERRRRRLERGERAWRARSLARRQAADHRVPRTSHSVSVAAAMSHRGAPVTGVFSIAAMTALRADARDTAAQAWLQVDDPVRWSDAYVGTGREQRDNDGLPGNCG